MNMREQRFGIEIELTGITRSSAARAVAGNFGTRSDHVGGGYDAYHVVDGEERTWKVMSDSSLRTEKREDGHKRAASNHYKVEVVSPSLRYGDIETLHEIVRALRRKGACANDSCGIHVHVDAAAHTPKTLRTLSNIVASKEDLLYRASGLGGVASSHRHANRTPSKRCRRNAATSESRLSHRRETWDFDMDDTPRAPVTSSTLRVEMPSRTSRPPRRRARGPPGSSALKTEVSL